MGILTSLDSDFSWFVAMGVSDTGKINGSKRERMKKGKKKKCENFHKNRKNESYVLINIYMFDETTKPFFILKTHGQLKMKETQR